MTHGHMAEAQKTGTKMEAFMEAWTKTCGLPLLVLILSGPVFHPVFSPWPLGFSGAGGSKSARGTSQALEAELTAAEAPI